MSEALLFGLILFVLVAAIIGARAWLQARPSTAEPAHPPLARSSEPTQNDDPAEEITVVDNVIVISDWKAEVDRRRSEPSADVG